MQSDSLYTSSKAQVSRAAIQRLYIAMRHLFIRGAYKPLGTSGEAMIDALLELRPEIYGDIADPERVEIDGLLYIFQRLPEGIEECKSIKLTSREGYENSSFDVIIPAKRRRNCYRIDKDQMYIEMTRGRSDIYDVLTHLTFMYIEAEKIRRNALDIKGRKRRDWGKLENIITKINQGEEFNKEQGYTYISTLIGRTFEETVSACKKFEEADQVNSLFSIVYWLGKNSIIEYTKKIDREITFSSTLREKLGHHTFGARWADHIKLFLDQKEFITRPIHIISSNLHSVMNCIYAQAALGSDKVKDIFDVAENLSIGSNHEMRDTVREYALENGMYELGDLSGTNIGVQLVDLAKVDFKSLPKDIMSSVNNDNNAILLVMDYAFGEQAYELMDELLKPYDDDDRSTWLDIKSINIMGKAGILQGGKGDMMIPNAHIFEGTADNYPFENKIDVEYLKGNGLEVFEGPMITVLGTSLQNTNILKYFVTSSWDAIGLEMEGAHYQKAIQAASKIRNSISSDVHLRYAYYASDNPLETGSTLSSGGLGVDGVKPTYLITMSILRGIFS